MGTIVVGLLSFGLGYLVCAICFSARIDDMFMDIKFQCKKCLDKKHEEGTSL